MLVTRKSSFTGVEHTMELNVTQAQMDGLKELPFHQGHVPKHIQDIFPNLSADEREFLKSGITKEEWDAEMNDDVDKCLDPAGFHDHPEFD